METPLEEKLCHSEWRLDFAKTLIDKISNIKIIDSIIVGGSVARGFADEYSDLEIGFFWKEFQRKEIIEAFQGELLVPLKEYIRVGECNFEDNIVVSSLQIDLCHRKSKEFRRTIHEVLEGRDLGLKSLNSCEVIESCIPLYGQNLIHKWKESLEKYPNKLRTHIIENNIVYLSNGNCLIHIYRNDLTAFYGFLFFKDDNCSKKYR